MHVRTYGDAGPLVIVMHGGPGAPGSVAAVARGLADSFRILEPWQCRSNPGGPRLTVDRHVEDLHELIESRCGGERPALVGSSWGAMLALAYAAKHPTCAGPLVLVGCGTFDREARKRMHSVIAERTGRELKRRIGRLTREVPDHDERLGIMGKLILPLYSFDPIEWGLETERCDARGHQETWSDMVRLQEEGVYPAAFAAIRSPVLMLHGAVDPHPGAMIHSSLAPYLPQLEYHEWERCGHFPWLERAVREEFFSLLRDWLKQKTIAGVTSVDLRSDLSM